MYHVLIMLTKLMQQIYLYNFITRGQVATLLTWTALVITDQISFS